MPKKVDRLEKLDRLERLMMEGLGRITEAEGLHYFTQYVREAIAVLKEQTHKLRR